MDSQKNYDYKICMVSDQLATGGAERYAAYLSQYFEQNRIKVHHVIVVDKVDYEYSGELLNLGKLKNESNGILNRMNRFWVLRQFFKKNKFDYIIDFRVKRFQLQEIFIAKFIYKSPLIVVVQNYITDLYFPINKFLANRIYSSNSAIVSVTNSIKNKILANYVYKEISVIPNPIDFTFIETKQNEDLNIDYKYILAVGRMEDNVKQFDKLIHCYAKSILPENDIKLIILGDGKLKSDFIQLAFDLKLADKIVFKGHVKNPFPYYKNAFFMVLSSLNEGLPFVLIEALICETPVVAFDCNSGPSEIIVDQENGLLVENQNQEKLIIAMNEMVLNEKLYYHCKSNAKDSMEKFKIKNIGQQWLQLLKLE